MGITGINISELTCKVSVMEKIRIMDFVKGENMRQKVNNKNILLIEEEYVNFLYIKELLGCLDYNVIRTISLEQAMRRAFLNTGFDLVIISSSLIINEPSQNKFNELKKLSGTWVFALDHDDEIRVNSYDYQWIDGVLSLSSDVGHFNEILMDKIEGQTVYT